MLPFPDRCKELSEKEKAVAGSLKKEELTVWEISILRGKGVSKQDFLLGRCKRRIEAF